MFAICRKGDVGRQLRGVASIMILLIAQTSGGSTGTEEGSVSPGAHDLDDRRANMVQFQLGARGIRDERVLSAMRKVPRHRFMPDVEATRAYEDRPHSIGEGQTISQPYIVALMSELARVEPPCRVLEVGTGSGYQAAVLAQVVNTVYSIEIKEKLYHRASKTLKLLGYHNVKTRHADGYFGWPQAAPFDAVMITAAIDHIPPALIKQLKDGGRLALPLGNPFSYQNLVLVTKQGDDLIVKQITGVLFVPMTGYALKKSSP